MSRTSELVRRLLYEERISQREMGERAETTQQMISDIVKRGNTNCELILKICKALGYDVIVKKGEKAWRV